MELRNLARIENQLTLDRDIFLAIKNRLIPNMNYSIKSAQNSLYLQIKSKKEIHQKINIRNFVRSYLSKINIREMNTPQISTYFIA